MSNQAVPPCYLAKAETVGWGEAGMQQREQQKELLPAN